MKTATPQQQIVNKGYTVVGGVLSEPEVAELREVCRLEMERIASDTISGSAFLKIPQLARIPFLQPVISALKNAIGGDAVIVPEFMAQAGGSGGWHFDASAMREATWLSEPDYLQVECAIYLQDAHPVYAGGLGVIPGSHRIPFSALGLGALPVRALRRLYVLLRGKQAVPTRAGDMLIWDFRLLHRGLPPSDRNIPEAHRKYGVFFGATTTVKHARLYMENMKERGERGESFYRDVAGLRFPQSYPQHLVERCMTSDIKVASL